MHRALLVVLAAGCGSGARYAGHWPRPLPASPQPVEPAAIRLSFAPVTVWEAGRDRILVGGGEQITRGARTLGPVRGEDHQIDGVAAEQLVCGWINDEHCDSFPDARPRSRPLVVEALASLQEAAAAAGATAIANVRCFARLVRIRGRRLWCEGDAVREPAPVAAQPLDETVSGRFDVRPSRWTVSATFTAGMFGREAVRGTTVGIARNTSELAFHMVAPFGDEAAALGGELLHGIRRGSLMARVGLSVLYLTALDAEMATGTGALGLEPKLAVSYHLDRWRFFNGFARVFGELRTGCTFVIGPDTVGGKQLGGPSVEVAIGFRSY